MKEKLKKIFNARILGYLSFFVFLFLNTIIGTVNQWGYSVDKYNIAYAIGTMISTVLFWMGFREFEKTEEKSNTQSNWIWISSLILIGEGLVIFAEQKNMGTILLQQELYPGVLPSLKKYIFDLVICIVFPIFMEKIFIAMKKDAYELKSVISAILQILLLTILEYVFFAPLPNTWLVDMAISNSIVLFIAIDIYVWKIVNVKRRCIMLGGGYAAIWTMILISRSSGESLIQYMCGNSWSAHVQVVKSLLVHAISMEKYELHALRFVELPEMLVGSHNYIHILLYYGGIAAGIALIAFLIIFMVVLVRLLGFSKRYLHKHYLIFIATFLMLAMRVCMGLLYALGAAAYPLRLPFSSDWGVMMDTVALTLMILCGYENKEIGKIVLMKYENVIYFLGETDVYLVENEDGTPYDDVNYQDIVVVRGKDREMICEAEWYFRDSHEYCVFTPLEAEYADKVFILEHDTNKIELWYKVEESELEKSIFDEHVQEVIPPYMVKIE